MASRSEESQFRRLCELANGPNPASTVRFGRLLLRDFPKNAVAWYLVGEALLNMARYEEAEQSLSKALDFISPDRRQIVLAMYGHLFRESGDYDQAASWYRQAIEVDPVDASYRIYLGAVLAKQGKFADAEESHREATECADGATDEAYLNLGNVLRARERFSEAAECFRKVLQIDPLDENARNALEDVERCF